MQRGVTQAGRAVRAMLGIAAITAAAACGSDKPAGPDNTPATVTANGTFPTSAVIASPINPSPSVVVRNSRGAPLPNVRVTFTVTAGNGLVLGASQLTDASGIATVDGWTLGDTPGVQTLTATAGGRTAVFSVNATNTCTISGTITVGGTVSGDLSTSPCAMGDGTAAQSWTFQQAPGQAALSFTMVSTGIPNFDTIVLMHRNTFTRFDDIIAGNDDDPAGATTNSRLNIILGPGSYVLSGMNYEPGFTGPFSLTASSWSGEFANCDADYVTPGITTNQLMDASCPRKSPAQYIDLAGLYLLAGQTVQIDMTSTAFDPELELYDGVTSNLITTNDNGGGGTSARLTYTAPVSNIFVIVPTSLAAGQTGAYTLTVSAATGGTRTGPAPAASRGAVAPARAPQVKGERSAFGWPTTHWLERR